jgi:hypothetical protein
MNLKALLAIAALTVSLHVYSLARAQGHEGHEGGREGGHEGHGGERSVPAPRPAPPRFQPHPAGAHPHGPIVRQHPVRVLAPKVAKYGAHQWRHWEHGEFSRPAYYWDWGVIHNVSCIAEDSYGDQYPVTESTFAGFGLANMTSIEDDALDRCYSESGGDQSCYLATCSHF